MIFGTPGSAETVQLWHVAASLLEPLGPLLEHNTSAYGTTTLGFVVATFVITAIGWAAPVASKWYRLRKSRAPEPFSQALKDSVLDRTILACGLVAIAPISYAASLAYTVYEEHQALVAYGTSVASENTFLMRELEMRKHRMVTTEPVFSNTTALLMAFAMYRHAHTGIPCVIMLTVPKADHGPLTGIVSQLSNSASDCTTFGPMNSDIDPDVERRAVDGMIPNRIVFHAERNSKAADGLFNSLEGLLPLQRSYDMPSAAERK